MRIRVALNTVTEVRDFVNAVTKVSCPVTLTDGRGLTVNGKSLMGVLYSLEFEELWCECARDIFPQISKFQYD